MRHGEEIDEGRELTIKNSLGREKSTGIEEQVKAGPKKFYSVVG